MDLPNSTTGLSVDDVQLKFADVPSTNSDMPTDALAVEVALRTKGILPTPDRAPAEVVKEVVNEYVDTVTAAPCGPRKVAGHR